MSKVSEYKTALAATGDWKAYLLENSGLPGPKANLELVRAVADMGDKALFLELADYGPDRAPMNSPHEFLAVCGIVGLGRLLPRGTPVFWSDKGARRRSSLASPRGSRHGSSNMGREGYGRSSNRDG